MRARAISVGAVVGFAGFGFTLVGLFLPYVVKTMPEAVSIPLVALGGLMIVVPCAIWLLHRLLGSRPPAPGTPHGDQGDGSTHVTSYDQRGGITAQTVTVTAKGADVE
jgi:hypothetical protein